MQINSKTIRCNSQTSYGTRERESGRKGEMERLEE